MSTPRTHSTTTRSGTRTPPSDLDDASSSELRQGIQQTREQIDETVDELERATSPRELIDQFIDVMRGGPGDFVRNFGRTVRDNPVPTALTGLGLIWLAASSHEDDERGTRVAARTRELGRESRREFWTQLNENPLVLGAIGVAVGAAIGAALPTTEAQEELLGEDAEHARERAREIAAQAADRPRPAAHSVAQETRSSVVQPGQSSSRRNQD
jgi:hypothetical protein